MKPKLYTLYTASVGSCGCAVMRFIPFMCVLAAVVGHVNSNLPTLASSTA